VTNTKWEWEKIDAGKGPGNKPRRKVPKSAERGEEDREKGRRSVKKRGEAVKVGEARPGNRREAEG